MNFMNNISSVLTEIKCSFGHIRWHWGMAELVYYVCNIDF